MEDAAFCETGDAAPTSLGAATETDPEIDRSEQAQQQVSPIPHAILATHTVSRAALRS